MLFSETYLYRAGCTRATSNALHDVITIIYIYFFSKSEHCHNTNNHSVTVLSKVSMIRLQSQSATKGVEEASEGALICSSHVSILCCRLWSPPANWKRVFMSTKLKRSESAPKKHYLWEARCFNVMIYGMTRFPVF